MAPSRDGVHVGMAVSLTGQFASQGRQALQGASMWVQDTNTGGGMYVASAGRRLPVHLTHYDDGSTVHGARSMTERLIAEDGVDILLGPYSSVLTLAACDVAERHGTVLWNHGGASDRIYEQGFRWCVGVLAPASRYLGGLVDLLLERDPRPRRAAVLHARRGTFPAAVASGLEEEVSRRGSRVVLKRAYHVPVTDFSALLDEVEAAEPDLVAGVGRIQDDLALARQIRSRGLRAEAVALVVAGVAEFGRDLGDQADGFMGPSQWEPAASYPPEYGPTVDRLALGHPGFASGDADYAMAQAYAAGLVAGRCVEEAGSLEAGALREAASTLDFTTFYGRFRVDPDTGRQVGRSVIIVQWQGGRKAVLWPPEMREAEPVDFAP